MNTTITTAAHTTSPAPVVGPARRGLRVAALSAGFGLLTLGLVACGNDSSGATGASTTAAASSVVSASAAAGSDAVVTVGDTPVVVALTMSNGTKVGTATVKPGGSVSVDSTKSASTSTSTPDDPNGTDVVTRIVDAAGSQIGTITVRPNGSVISISGSGTVSSGSGSVPSMSMPPMSMPSMNMDMSGMPMPGQPGDQVNDSVNTGGSPTTIVSTSCSPDGSQCSRSEIVQN